MTDEDNVRVIICQGPPACLLVDDEAVAAQEAGCSLCRVDTLQPDGCWSTQEPVKWQ